MRGAGIPILVTLRRAVTMFCSVDIMTSAVVSLILSPAAVTKPES